MINVNELLPHPKNNFFFDDIKEDNWVEFKKSIETSGVIEPIVITQNKIIVSGHQRVRACKELNIEQVPCKVHIYDDEDKILKDLLETNIRQRGMGNPNPVKFGRCIMELERLYGVRQGSAGKRSLESDNLTLKTQTDVATDLGISKQQSLDYKKLTTLIPELQTLIEQKELTATVGYKILARMSNEEQEKLLEELGKDKLQEMTQKQLQDYIKEKELLENTYNELSGKYSQVQQQIQQLKNRPPEVVDKTDYAKISQLERSLSDLKSQINKLSQEKNDYQNKYVKSLSDLKQEQEKVSQFMGNSTSFELVKSTSELTSKMIDFVKDMAKYDYMAESFNDLPDATRKEYVRSIYGVYKWARSILNEVKHDDVLGVNTNIIEYVEYEEVIINE